MITIGALAALILVRLQDAVGGGADLPAWLEAWQLATFAIATPFAAVSLAWWRVIRLARRLDRTGDARAVLAARRWVGASRLVTIAVHTACVFALGWVGLVRSVVGNWPLLDEVIAAAPCLGALVLSLGAWHPIELRLREAAIFRELDRGGPVYPPPTLRQHIIGNARFQIGTLLIPLLLILFVSESIEFAGHWAMGPLAVALPDWARSPGFVGAAVPAAQLMGAVGVLLLAPPVLRLVWDAPPLRDGPVRELADRVLKQHGVAVREVVLWRTGGAIVNAAVIGIAPSLRYLALSDGLVDHLPDDELEAVIAHEVGHLRRRHMPWLAAATIGAVLLAGGVMGWLLVALEPFGVGVGPSADLAILISTFATLGATLLVIGWVSRRFEWQADAFAAAHLSTTDDEPNVAPRAADAMASALAHVTRLAGGDPRRSNWRHGSVVERQRRLTAIVGQSLARLPQDLVANRVKTLAIIALALGLAMLALESWWAVSQG